MGRWRLALGVAVVLAIGIWDVGLPGGNANHAAGKSSVTVLSPIPDPAPPGVPGVLQPKTAAEFTATFSGTRLDPAVWTTCYPEWHSPGGCTNYGNAHTEDEWYQPSQDQVYGGLLHLVAQREPTPGKTESGRPMTYPCRSGMVASYPGLQFEYGYIQVVAFVPTNDGLWPALWLAASNFQWPPEMDMLESWGSSNFFAASYFHFATPRGDSQLRGVISPSTLASGWHTFALSWTKTQLSWLVDGKIVLSTQQHVPHQKMYFIANLAQWISKTQPVVLPGECNGSLLIRSVQVWKA